MKCIKNNFISLISSSKQYHPSPCNLILCLTWNFCAPSLSCSSKEPCDELLDHTILIWPINDVYFKQYVFKLLHEVVESRQILEIVGVRILLISSFSYLFQDVRFGFGNISHISRAMSKLIDLSIYIIYT